MEQPKLSRRTLQVLAELLSQRLGEGYAWRYASDVARQLTTPDDVVSAGTVAQILTRLFGYGWLDSYQAEGSQGRLFRVSAAGAENALAALSERGVMVSGTPGVKTHTLTTLEAELRRDDPDNADRILAYVRRKLDETRHADAGS